MIRKVMAKAALAASLTLVAGFAQTPAELLQKGIYTQETAGDLDGAIQIYRQVVGLASNQPAIAAQAQFRLTESLLQKGDLAGAGPEFETLARSYSGQQELVDAMGQRLRTIAANGPAQLLGSFQNGRYHHYWTGVELTQPPGWTFKGQMARPDGWDRVDLIDGAGKAGTALVVIRRAPGTGQSAGQGDDGGWQSVGAITNAQGVLTDIDTVLQQRLQAKLTNQRQDSQGYHSYAYRPGSVQHRTVGGRQALSAVADYKDDKGAAMNEYVVFVATEKSRVFFSVLAAATDFQAVMARFEPIVSTAVVP